ncbi:DUF4192 domain-containing protein [Pseudonocardiaceae bacterium YIM PH 21723]|nr:DUF4192 domain-containing protein [Pseudonocardiaceae bacterium YIM PH 21723]
MTSTPTIASLSGPAEMLASVPAMLGFHPENSLILIGLTGQGRTLRHSVTMRHDIPEPPHYNAVIDTMLKPMTRHGITSVCPIIVHPPDDDGPPATDLVERVGERLGLAGMTPWHPLWMTRAETGADWGCYRPGCTGCGGPLPDPRTTQLAAHAVLSGKVTAGSRQDILSRLDPDPEPVLAARREILAGHLDARWMLAPETEVEQIVDLLTEFSEGRDELSDERLVRLGILLGVHGVRDPLIGLLATPMAEQFETLLVTLVRGLPESIRADSAILLGLCAYYRGNCVLGAEALGIGLDLEPGHSLGRLIHILADAALPPGHITPMIDNACAELHRVLSC